jgi:hypothetical protein
MNPSRRLAGLAALGASVLMLGACAPLTVHSFTVRGTNFATYRTYGWADDASRATGDPRLDNNPFFQTRIQTDTDRQLTTLGFEKVASAPDLLVHYHASVTQKLDIGAADQAYACDDCPGPSMYDAGTILLDIVDARTNKLIWRGWAETNMDGVVNNQASLEQRIDEAIAKIVATIPGRL